MPVRILWARNIHHAMRQRSSLSTLELWSLGSVGRMGLLPLSDPVKTSDNDSLSSSKDSNFGAMSPKSVCGRLKTLSIALDV